ncbi:MAG: hypothetical protein Q8Q01_04030 [archaeon]|nr:hypothetical protein [archaeon]
MHQESIEPEFEEEKYPKLKKALIIAVGILLIILITSFIIVGYPLGHILEGQIESEPLQENIIQLDNLAILFEGNSLENLREIYHSTQNVEFSVCLQGRKESNDYHITSLYVPVTYEQAFDHVTFEPCSNETLIMLHSHPYKSCLASDTDINTLESNKGNNPDILMVVMCEPGRFSVYE